MNRYLDSLDAIDDLPDGVDLVHEFPPPGDDTTAPLFTVGTGEHRPARGLCHCGSYQGREHYGSRLYIDEAGCLRPGSQAANLARYPHLEARYGCRDAVDSGYFDGPTVEMIPQSRPEPRQVAAVERTWPPVSERSRPAPRHVARKRSKTGRQAEQPTTAERAPTVRLHARRSPRPLTLTGRQLETKGA